jgi:hypothetical protein
MEVHHHASTPPKKWRHYFWEFLMLFLAVTLGFYAENLREKIIHKEEAKASIRSLLADLQSDLSYLDSILVRNGYSCEMADSLINGLHSDLSNTSQIYYFARATTANLGYYYSNSKSFEQMKNSGVMKFVRPRSLLDDIGAYYVRFQWLANQTELMRMKADQLHKGNHQLFDSYVFDRMMKIIYANSTGRTIINRPEGNPPLLSRDPAKLNDVSMNYHYFVTTSRFLNGQARVQLERAKKLIDLIKIAYHF